MDFVFAQIKSKTVQGTIIIIIIIIIIIMSSDLLTIIMSSDLQSPKFADNGTFGI